MDDYKVVKLAAHQAFDTFINNKKPNDMSIQYLEENQLTLNADIIEKLKLNVPEKLKKVADFVHTQ